MSEFKLKLQKVKNNICVRTIVPLRKTSGEV